MHPSLRDKFTMDLNRCQSASLQRFLSVGHNGNKSLNFNEADEEFEISLENEKKEDEIFPKHYPLHKTRSYSFSQCNIDHDNPICTSTPIKYTVDGVPNQYTSNKRRSSLNNSLNNTFRRFLQPKMGSHSHSNFNSQPSHKICRYLDSPECSRVYLKNNNSEISPIVARYREDSYSCLKSPRKDKDFLHRLNCASSEGEDGNFMLISNQPDPTCDDNDNDNSFLGSNPTSFSAGNKVCVNNNKLVSDPNATRDESVMPTPPCPSTPLFTRRISPPRANFLIAKSKTTDAVVIDRPQSWRRPSDFPKTNFHLFGHRVRKSVGELAVACNKSATSTPIPNRVRFGSVPSIQLQFAEETRKEEWPQQVNNVQDTISSTPATPDLGKNRRTGNLMRRSATIAFSKGRKLSGLLGYSLPRRYKIFLSLPL